MRKAIFGLCSTICLDIHRMLSVLRYKPFFLLGIELDAEWSRSRDLGGSQIDPLASLNAKLRNVCAGYRKNVEEVASKRRNGISGIETRLDSFLFNPIFCLPSGHADGLAFILADDFDAVHHIASHSRVIEDMTLAFCPETESLGLHDNHYIVDVEKHWDKNAFSISLFSRFKLDGVCNLEYGLLFKRATIRAMARRVSECASAFAAIQKASGHSLPPLAVSFVCLQGQEEIGVLCSSTDVTVAVALSSAFRSLTLPELFIDMDSDVETALLHRLLQKGHDTRKGENGYVPGALHDVLLRRTGIKSGNIELPRVPVFRWSKSVLGFRLEDRDGKMELTGRTTGRVSMDLDLQLVPGVNVDLSFIKLEPADPVDTDSTWRFVEVGSFDARRSLTSVPLTTSGHVAAAHLLSCIDRIVSQAREKKRIGVVGIHSVFTVPVPNAWPFCVLEEVVESPLDFRLYQVRYRMDSNEYKDACLSITQLLNVPQSYGLPKALRRSIETLFRNFATAVSNPNLYDLVIDLYDVFNTLHRVLTQIFPALLSPSPGVSTHIHPLKVYQISQFATVLRNALERRLVLAYPDSTVRNTSLQFPGSLVQILFSTDAPLKAALGVLKYHLPSGTAVTTDLLDELKPLDEVGVVSDITLEPGIRAFNLAEPFREPITGVRTARLSFLSLDVDHLFYVGSLFDYIHEVCHLIFDQLVMRSNTEMAIGLGETVEADKRSRRDRVEEMFVQLTCFLFCAPDRPVELLHYLVGKYALDMRSARGELSARIVLFAEILVRMVIPCWLVKSHLLKADENKAPELLVGDADRFFSQHIDGLMQLFPETSSLSDAALAKTKEIFLQHLHVFWDEAKLNHYLPRLWPIALDVYRKLSKDHLGYRVEQRAQYTEMLGKMADGFAITRYDMDSKAYVDSVAATSLILGQYLTRHGLVNQEQRVHLDRDEKMNVEFRHESYSPYLIDRGSAQRACFDPSARGRRLRNQIGILESFWDCSSHFRARRVMDLLLRFRLDR